MTDIEDTRRTAKIYFQRGFETLAKDLAASIRNQRSHAHLIDQKNFESAENVLGADAVLIQATAPNARRIGRAYSEYGGAGCEVLFFDNDGKITKLELVEPTTSFATLLGATDEKDDSAVTGKATSRVLEDTVTDAAADAAEAAGCADIKKGNSA